MAAQAPKKKSIDDIKSKLLQPALTSHFQCEVVIPEKIKTQLGYNKITVSSDLTDLLMLSCSEASLPGSSLGTHELNDDFTGITQRHAYRRLYDDRASFSFYVNQKDYVQIRIFEIWMRYITGEQLSFGEKTNVAYRVSFPEDYKSTIYLTKFDRDISTYFTYTFVNAFPIQLDSMPVSYDSSQLLKCSVSFAYDRYILSNDNGKAIGDEDPSSSSSTTTSTSQFGSVTNNTAAAYGTNLGLDYGKYTTTGGVTFPPASSSGNNVETSFTLL